MYAIIINMDTNCLKGEYRSPYKSNANKDIRKFMEFKGFDWQQGNVYFGKEETTAVKCVTTIQELNNQYFWFKHCVEDIRMLRIEENNSMMRAIDPTSFIVH